MEYRDQKTKTIQPSASHKCISQRPMMQTGRSQRSIEINADDVNLQCNKITSPDRTDQGQDSGKTDKSTMRKGIHSGH
jgi:hypothetical protein